MSPSPQEQARLDALHRYQILHTPPEEAFERLTRLAARTFSVPIALISLVDDQRQWFKSCYGLPLKETGREVSFCAHTLHFSDPDELLVVPDATLDPRFQANPLVTGWPHIRFYAGAPLRTPDGHVLGSLCLIDTQPREPLMAEEADMLRELAAIVMDTLHHRLAATALLESQQLLEEQQRQIELTLAHARAALWSIDFATGAVQVQADFQALGLPEALAPTSIDQLLALIHPDDRAAVQAHLTQAMQEGRSYSVQARLQLLDGQVLWTTSQGAVQRDVTGRPYRLLATTFDISRQHQTESALARSDAMLRQIVETIQDAIYVKDRQGRYVLVNQAAAQLMNSTVEHVLGKTDTYFLSPAEVERVTRVDQHVMSSAQAITYEFPLIYGHENRTMLTSKYPFIQDGELCGIVGVSRDITTQQQLQHALQDANTLLEAKVHERTQDLERLNRQFQHDAMHDVLTGLPNRALFMNRLKHAIERQRNAASPFAVLFLDFDRFKLVNDSLGHAAGDELLLAIAARLQASVATVNTVARLGGDEFTLLLEDVQSREEILQRVKVVQQLLARPFRVAGQDLRITASIGIALGMGEDLQADDLVRDADIAMYQAKTQQKGGFLFFEPAMYDRQLALLNLQRDLRKAIENSELRVHYQPILRLADGAVIGVEALVRWQHPEHGLISPAEFIPLAEESGLICEIDLWVLRQGCRQLREWNAGRPTPLMLSVNLSAQHFDHPGVVGQVQWILAEEGVEAQRVHLEITESLLMAHHTQALEALRAFRALGLEVVVDDFGTGYSNLSYLQRFPLDGLKIDRSFVMMAAEQPEVVQTIVTLGRTLNMHVVAEGLEDTAQVEQLRGMNCDFGQGYVFARPMPAHELVEFLQKPE